jgi:hypothetical protein
MAELKSAANGNERMGSVLTLRERVAVDFAKFFSSRCQVLLCSAGEHGVGSQMTEVSRLLTRLRRAKEVSEAVQVFTNHVTV